MDARFMRLAVLVAAIASLGAGYRTQNFIVNAPTQQMAEQIGRAAEKYRRDLAVEWIGEAMPNWYQACPITANVADELGAGGETSFVFENGHVFGWRMKIQGSLVRVLDSVLPHEVMHTVFATHFRQPLPRWADEGACTTVEHDSEKAKQQQMLIRFLQTDKGIAFNRMFAMKDYPRDVLPLYSQGYSVARYLIAQGGKRKFLDFVADGLKDENWSRAVNSYYGVPNLAALQNNWLDWVRKGSPNIDPSRNNAIASVSAQRLAAATVRPLRPATLLAPAETNHRRPAPGQHHRPLRLPRQLDRRRYRRQVARAAAQAPGPDGIARNTPPVAGAPRAGGANASIYQLAATRKDLFEATTSAPAQASEWQPANVPSANRASDTASNVSVQSDRAARQIPSPPEPDRNLPNLIPYQATRPQVSDRPQQVIVEWSR